jgi:hypothetical protein
MVIINPDSGPGAHADPAYTLQVARAHAASSTLSVLGYVHTSYGRRAMADVRADVAAFFDWYDVDGIFVDEVSSDAAAVSYYASVAAFIRGQRAPAVAERGAATARGAGSGAAAPLVVLNPGTNLDVAFEPHFDVVMSFEGPLADYAHFEPAPWLRNATLLAPTRVWHCIHSIAEGAPEQLAGAIARSKTLNAGWVFATNETLPNPYAALPSEVFWEDVERWAANVY